MGVAMRRSMLTAGALPPIQLGNAGASQAGLTGYTFGSYWQTGATGFTAKAMGWYGLATGGSNDGYLRLSIYSNGGTMLASTGNIYLPAGALRTREPILFGTPYTLAANTLYMFAVYVSANLMPAGGTAVPVNTVRASGANSLTLIDSARIYYATGESWPNIVSSGYTHAEMYVYF